MRNRKTTGVICILLTLLIIVGFICTKDKLEKNNNTTMKNSASASWHECYGTLNDMVDAADIIIQGNSIDSYAEQLTTDLIATNEIIEVKKVYQGNVKEGDRIEVLQTGGELNNIRTAPIEDAPLLTKGADYLLLLRKSTDGLGNYLILGGFQGILEMQKNGSIKFNNENDPIAQEFRDNDITEFEEILLKTIQK
jgi:hypothetical protein